MSKCMLIVETKQAVRCSPTEAKALYENGTAVYLSKAEYRRLTELPGQHAAGALNTILKEKVK